MTPSEREAFLTVAEAASREHAAFTKAEQRSKMRHSSIVAWNKRNQYQRCHTLTFLMLSLAKWRNSSTREWWCLKNC